MQDRDGELEIRIGKRIRELRKKMGWTQQQLAESAGLAKGTLSKIELGQISSPISTYSRIAQSLNVIFEDFVRWQEPQNYVISRRDDLRPTASQEAPHGYRFELLGENWPNRNVVAYVITYYPESQSRKSPEFQHEMDEIIYVLEGELDYYYDTESFILYQGDCIFVDGSHPHGGRAHGNQTCRALLLTIAKG